MKSHRDTSVFAGKGRGATAGLRGTAMLRAIDEGETVFRGGPGDAEAILRSIGECVAFLCHEEDQTFSENQDPNAGHLPDVVEGVVEATDAGRIQPQVELGDLHTHNEPSGMKEDRMLEAEVDVSANKNSEDRNHFEAVRKSLSEAGRQEKENHGIHVGLQVEQKPTSSEAAGKGNRKQNEKTSRRKAVGPDEDKTGQRLPATCPDDRLLDKLDAGVRREMQFLKKQAKVYKQLSSFLLQKKSLL